MSAENYTPSQLAETLGAHEPTSEQAAVISAGMEPLLVVAGAGSGKTATMTDRVLWLVANQKVQPEGILGLTFTRKAAGELAERVRGRLEDLRRRTGEEIEGLQSGLGPEISTYHSFAQALVRDHGMRIGIEPDATLIDEAHQWMLMTRIANSYDGNLDGVAYAKATLIEAALNYSGQAAEHLVEPAETVDWLHEHADRIAELPPGATARTKNPSPLIGKLRSKAVIADLAGRYQTLKRERSLLDFGDLIKHAVTLARIPEISAAYRERFPVVLLDEFQDTSHAQMELFHRLFGHSNRGHSKHCITAVGDPNQAIYSFRGASAGQLESFKHRFGTTEEDGTHTPAPQMELTIAWRNGHSILDAANRISEPLRGGDHGSDHEAEAVLETTADASGGAAGPIARREREITLPSRGSLHVSPLRAHAHAETAEVRLASYLLERDEAEGLADAIQTERETHYASHGTWPSVAMLTRVRSNQETYAEALRERGIPVEVVGLKGLTETPEVQDIIATLTVINDPGRSDSLMRLLAGARWRIGPADLMALNDYAEYRAKRRAYAIQHQLPADFESEDGSKESDRGFASDTGEIVESASLIEALHNLPQPGWVSKAGRTLSEAAHRRLTRLKEELTYLRSLANEDLPTVVTEIERVLGLDIELLARPYAHEASARRHVDAFMDLVVTFDAAQETPDLTAFLEWLSIASDHGGGIEQAPEPATDGTVQILTVHGSKGLEWDVVALPGMREGDFPSDRATNWVTDVSEFPWPLRGDRDGLPQFTALEDPQQWVDNQRDLTDLNFLPSSSKKKKEGAPEYKTAVAEHAVNEERRLAYVGVTRARSLVLCSSSRFKGTNKKPSESSQFFTELTNMANSEGAGSNVQIARGLTAEEGQAAENPEAATIVEAAWPYDPLEGPTIRHVQPASLDEDLVSQAQAAQSSEPRGPVPHNLVQRVIAAPAAGRRAAVEAAADHVRSAARGLQNSGVNGETLAEHMRTEAGREWAEEAHLLLLERAASEQQHTWKPSHVRASLLVETEQNPDSAFRNLVRPVPHRPGIAAQQGTEFHEWVEEHFNKASGFGLDDQLIPDLDVYADAEDSATLDALKEGFLASEWAGRIPHQVEAPVETAIAGVSVRGFIDAVYKEDDGWLLVDWKTGRVPSKKELPAKARQLAVYRLAWSRLTGTPIEKIKTAFYYVGHGTTVWPEEEQLATEAELEAALQRTLNPETSGGTGPSAGPES